MAAKILKGRSSARDVAPLLQRYFQDHVTRADEEVKKWLSDHENVEAMHHLRVHVRRVTSMLKLFKPYLPKARRQRVNACLKKCLRASGVVREQDLFLIFIRDHCNEIPRSQTPALYLMEARVRMERRASVQSALTVLASSDLLKILRETSTLCSNNKGKIFPFRLTVGDAIRDVVMPRYEEFTMELCRIASDTVNSTLLHETRLMGKPLRYAFEFFIDEFSSKRGRRVAGRVNNIVQNLGRIHDCDIAIQFLGRMKDEFELFQTIAPRTIPALRLDGIYDLLKLQSDNRRDLVIRLRRIIEEWDSSPLWQSGPVARERKE